MCQYLVIREMRNEECVLQLKESFECSNNMGYILLGGG